MKKLLLGLAIFFYGIGNVLAKDLDVKANIESGKYDFVIEVNLISNKENSKIFYYTDGEGRMDHILEFKKGDKIIIKEDTQLNYYAMGEDFSETQIKENIYTFEYPTKLEISYENSKIKIKNNSGDVVNLGYFKIEGDSLNYEINKYTYIENSKFFELDYNVKNNETIKLITPNNKLISSFKYQEKIEKKEEIKQEKIENNEEKNIVTEVIVDEEKPEETNIPEEKSENIIQQSISTIGENLNKNQFLHTENEVQKENIQEEFDINEELKSSISDKSNKDFYIFAYLFLIIILGTSAYNLYNLLKSYTKGQKQK